MTTTKQKKENKLPENSMNPELKKMMEQETKIVRGRFKYYEIPGGTFPFCAGKYPGQPIFKATFVDGEVYDVPLWVARHLNGKDVTAKAIDGNINSCSYPIHAFKWEKGKEAPLSQVGMDGIPVPVVGIGKRKQRVGFESLEFSTTE